MKVRPDFEKEIKAIDPRLDIVPNPYRTASAENKQGISNIKLEGQDIIPIPSDEIFDDINPNFGYLFPNGMRGRFKTRPEALAAIEGMLKFIQTKDGMDAFTGKGEYNDKVK